MAIREEEAIKTHLGKIVLLHDWYVYTEDPTLAMLVALKAADNASPYFMTQFTVLVQV